MPKPTRPPHSRSSSATKLAQKEPKASHLPPPPTNPNGRPAFTLPSPATDDDDGWVSTESGVATPNHHHSSSDSDTASEEGDALQRDIQRDRDRELEQRTFFDRSLTARQNLVSMGLAASNSPSNGRRNSRPPSTHSTHEPLRPHPLIRGMSHGHLSMLLKPSPLAPLTVLPTTSTESEHTTTSASPTSSIFSPISSIAPDSYPPMRRDSFSSTHSVTTIPVHSTIISTHHRPRTLSAMASSSAFSSLSHLPAVTRPPSPQPILFFPPVNPHANLEGIHPLLPVPYLHNHLTVLARRTPLRESFDRVTRAKNARSDL